MIVTRSPTFPVLPGSCTRYFFERTRYFLYFECFSKRSTRTVAVSFIAAFTTTPTNVWGRGVFRSIQLCGASCFAKATKGTSVLLSEHARNYLAQLHRGIRFFRPRANSRESLRTERAARVRQKLCELPVCLPCHYIFFCHTRSWEEYLAARDNRRSDRQFHPRFPQMCARHVPGNAVELKQDATRAHFEDVVFRVALAAPHAHLRRLGSYRPVRKDSYPEFAGLRGGARKHLACRLYLIARYTRVCESLEAEGPECNGGTARVRSRKALLA